MATYVIKSYCPDYGDYSAMLEDVFKRNIFTNYSPYVGELEKRLIEYLHVPYLTLCANATLGLQMALHAAGLAGRKVITTPFTYVATVSALLWVGCEVIFADIDEETLCLSPRQVANKMRDDISGLMPVDIYDGACDFAAFSQIAKSAANGPIPVIYDAAQAFGSSYKNKSLLDYGDMAVCSFHATKAFHTFEGGCIVSHSPEAGNKLFLLSKFGHIDDTHFCLGINAKMSEAHAVMGLVMLDKVKEFIAARKKISEAYDELITSPAIRRPRTPADFQSNYTYYPLIFDTEKALLKVVEVLRGEEIYPRRYFYPSLTQLPYLSKQSCPVADSIAPRVLCLPLYADMPLDLAQKIAEIVNTTL